jgi:hypothetical protein
MARHARKPLKLLAEIRRDLVETDRICVNWEERSEPEEEERVEGLLERAFESALVLMETIGRRDTRTRILALYERAKKRLTATKYSINAMEPYSVWSYRLSNILNAVEKAQFQLAKDAEEPLDLVLGIVDRLQVVERALKHRYNSRKTLRVKDEYDIQDLLRSLLAIHFDDVSAEDPGPKFAGSSNRIDLFLRREGIAIEVKKTRSSLSEAALGRALKLDIVDYRQREFDALVIVIDDKRGRLKNPKGFVRDLRKVEKGFHVEVRILS